MNVPDWWFNSGFAAQAARELMWFVVLVFVVIGVLMWRDMKQDKPRQPRNVQQGEKK